MAPGVVFTICATPPLPLPPWAVDGQLMVELVASIQLLAVPNVRGREKFQVLILPWKMLAMVGMSSFRLLTPERLYDIVIGPSMTGKYSTVFPLKFATSSEGIGESEPANWTTPEARSERPLPEPPPP